MSPRCRNLFQSSGMMGSTLFLFVLVAGSSSVGIFSEAFTRDGCQGLLESFAEVTANFTRCTIQNARPIKVCQACVDTYLDVCKSYQEILKLHDEGGNPCKLELINVDRLEVVEASYSFVINQWNRASCNYCFKNVSNKITPEKTELTTEILGKYDVFSSCISDNSNNKTNSTSKVCTDCASEYHDLNEYYNDHKNQGFCMDIVDMINSTRSSWSQDFGCCAERDKPELIFLITASLFCSTPLIFYLFVRLWTVKHLLPISPPKRWDRYLRPSSSAVTLGQ